MNLVTKFPSATGLAGWIPSFVWLRSYQARWLRAEGAETRLGGVDRFASVAEVVNNFLKDNHGRRI